MRQGVSNYNIGTKFNEDGTVRFFPGNTVLSMIDPAAPVFQTFKQLQKMLEAKGASRCVTMLPDDSLHMTVIEGVCDQWRRPELWTNLLPLDCKLTEVDDLFERAFATVRPLGEVQMAMESTRQISGISFHANPVSEQDAAELKRYRNDVGKAFGVHFPNHDDYRFHISMCYFTKEPTEAEWAEIDAFREAADAYIAAHPTQFIVQPPMLTFFDNMFRFNPYRIPR